MHRLLRRPVERPGIDKTGPPVPFVGALVRVPLEEVIKLLPVKQLLLAFVRDRQTKGKAVQWTGVPTWFETSVQQLGLTAALSVARA